MATDGGEVLEAPNWLKELEAKRERRVKAKLGHETGAGAACIVCIDKCPGLDLHFWRKICKNCKCSKEDHDVPDDDIHGWAEWQLLGSKPNRIKTKITLPSRKGEEVELEWTPKGQKETVEKFLQTLPPEQIPIKGSQAAQDRKQLLQKQIPIHDIDPGLCHELTPEEHEQMTKYVTHVKEKSVGVGQLVNLGSMLQGIVHTLDAQQVEFLRQKYGKNIPLYELVKLQSQQLSMNLEKMSLNQKPNPKQQVMEQNQNYKPIGNIRDLAYTTYNQNTPGYNSLNANYQASPNKVHDDVQYQSLPINVKDIRGEILAQQRKPSAQDPHNSPYNSNNYNSDSLKRPGYFNKQLGQINANQQVEDLQQFKPIKDLHVQNYNQNQQQDMQRFKPIKDSNLQQYNQNQIPEDIQSATHFKPITDVYGDQNQMSYGNNPGVVHPAALRPNVDHLGSIGGRPIEDTVQGANFKPIRDIHGLQNVDYNTDYNPYNANQSIGGRIREDTGQGPNFKPIGDMHSLQNLDYNTNNPYNTNQSIGGRMHEDIGQGGNYMHGAQHEDYNTNNVYNPNQRLPSMLQQNNPNRTNLQEDILQPQNIRIGSIRDINQQTFSPNIVDNLESLHPEEAGTIQIIKDLVIPDCHHCNKPFATMEFAITIEKSNLLFHAACFKCAGCQQVLADNMYFYHKETNNVYCLRDYAKVKGYPRCKGCDELIFTKEYCLTEENTFHLKHFCCIECDTPLAGQNYVLVNSQPVCLICDQKKANTCLACRQTIRPDEEGLMLKDSHFHTSNACFCCKVCTKPLLGQKLLFRNERLYCSHDCFQTDQQ